MIYIIIAIVAVIVIGIVVFFMIKNKNKKDCVPKTCTPAQCGKKISDGCSKEITCPACGSNNDSCDAGEVVGDFFKFEGKTCGGDLGYHTAVGGLNDCMATCANNSRCQGFAFRGSDNACARSADCSCENNSVNSSFDLYVKKT